MGNVKTIVTNSPEETIEVASCIGRELLEGDFVALTGEVGSGKTMFTKGLAKGLGVEDYLYVNSPSFVIMKEYVGVKKLYHFDVYRLEEESFMETLDYDKYFYGDGITVVEWADKIEDVLPDEYLEIDIEHRGDTERAFKFIASGERLRRMVELL